MSTDHPQTHGTKARFAKHEKDHQAGQFAAAAIRAAKCHQSGRYSADWYRQEIQRIERQVDEAECRDEYTSALRIQQEQAAKEVPAEAPRKLFTTAEKDALLDLVIRARSSARKLEALHTSEAEAEDSEAQRTLVQWVLARTDWGAPGAGPLTKALRALESKPDVPWAEEPTDPRGDFVELGDEIP